MCKTANKLYTHPSKHWQRVANCESWHHPLVSCMDDASGTHVQRESMAESPENLHTSRSAVIPTMLSNHS